MGYGSYYVHDGVSRFPVCWWWNWSCAKYYFYACKMLLEKKNSPMVVSSRLIFTYWRPMTDMLYSDAERHKLWSYARSSWSSSEFMLRLQHQSAVVCFLSHNPRVRSFVPSVYMDLWMRNLFKGLSMRCWIFFSILFWVCHYVLLSSLE